MKLLEFWTGLALGFAGYHILCTPYMVKRGISWGMAIAAAQVKLWYDSLPVDVQTVLQPYMQKAAEGLPTDGLTKE